MRNKSGSVNTHVGQRSLVWGNSCSGKSTLASQIARSRGLPFVELDALNWLPNWVGLNATDPDFGLFCYVVDPSACPMAQPSSRYNGLAAFRDCTALTTIYQSPPPSSQVRVRVRVNVKIRAWKHRTRCPLKPA